MSKRNIIIVGAAVMVGLIGIGAAAGGSSSVDGSTPSAGTTQPASSTAPVAEASPAASPEPISVAPVVEPITMADVTAAQASADCATILAQLGDETRMAATTDLDVMTAGLEVVGRCITGEYVVPKTDTKLNTFATVGDWSVKISKVNWNAWPAIHKANMFNDKNPKGTTDVLVYGTVKYNGSGREEFDSSMLKAVGQSGTEYDTFTDPTCGVMPDPNLKLDAKTLRHGASQKGYLACFVVDNSDLKSLTAFAEPMFSFDDEDIVDFALR